MGVLTGRPVQRLGMSSRDSIFYPRNNILFSQIRKGTGPSSASGPDGDCRSLVPYDRTNRMLMASSMGVPMGQPVQRLGMSSEDALAASEMTNTQLRKDLMRANHALGRVMKENERLNAENSKYAQVLEGFMEAQDTEQERNRPAAIEVANVWNADIFPLQTEPQQSYASSPQRKRTRASCEVLACVLPSDFPSGEGIQSSFAVFI